MRQTCSCRCGASHFAVSGEPIGRFYCHCTICQAFNGSPYADVTALPARAVALPDNSAVAFRSHRPPPAIDRGSCPACGGPVVEFHGARPAEDGCFRALAKLRAAFRTARTEPPYLLSSTRRRRDRFASEGQRVLGERDGGLPADFRRHVWGKTGRIDCVVSQLDSPVPPLHLDHSPLTPKSDQCARGRHLSSSRRCSAGRSIVPPVRVSLCLRT